MANESPASVLFNRDGYDVAITDGYSIINGQPGVILAGKDGSTARFLALDSLGHPIVVGSGNFTVVQPNAANLHALVVGAAADSAIPVGNPLLIAGSDGYVRTIRTASDGTIRIDPTGTTVQPVSQSGTWTVNQGTTPWLTLSNVTDGYLQNILANQTNGTQHTIVDGYVQTNPNVNVNNFPAIQAVSQSGTWTVQQGTPPWSIIGTSSDNSQNSVTKLSSLVAIAKASATSWTDGYQVPLRTLLTGQLTTDVTTWMGSSAPTVGQKTMANSIPIAIASDQTVIPADVTDRAGRLLGVVYGSQGQQIKQTATNYNSQVEIAVGSTLIDPRVQGTAAALSGAWPIKLTDGYNTMPTGDTVGRSVFNQISDGYTGPVAVKPGLTAPQASDKALVVVLSPNQQAIPVSSAPALADPGLTTGRVVLGGSTANTLQVIRATTYNEQTANAQRSIASSSANDSAAGTGARKIEIIYFDASGNGPYTEIITLNGTTPVPTAASNICFIEKMTVVEVGSVGSNVGTITLYVNNSGGGGTIGTIGIGNLVAAVGDNTTLWAHHYIPAGKTASFATIIVAAYSGGSPTNATFYLKSKNPNIPNDAEIIVSDILLVTASFTRTLGIPIEVSGFARIIAYAVPGVNNAILAASFDFAEI